MAVAMLWLDWTQTRLCMGPSAVFVGDACSNLNKHAFPPARLAVVLFEKGVCSACTVDRRSRAGHHMAEVRDSKPWNGLAGPGLGRPGRLTTWSKEKEEAIKVW